MGFLALVDLNSMITANNHNLDRSVRSLVEGSPVCNHNAMPKRMPVLFEKIPGELKAGNNWVLWKWEFRNGILTKPPYQAAGRPAKSNDPATWADFNTVLQAVNSDGSWCGIGYMLDGGYTGIDWDDCISPTGDIDPTILDHINSFNSYTEISPSGTGLKTLVRAKLPAKGHHQEKIGVFDSRRYFCITGQVFPDVSSQIEDRQYQLDQLIRQYWPGDLNLKRASAVARPSFDLCDDDLIEKAIKANDSGKFRSLWGGDVSCYASPSEADMALCCKLAFYTRKNPERIDRLFRRSGLMREKWNRDDYRTRTIEGAIEKTVDVYDPRLYAADPGSQQGREATQGGMGKNTLKLSVDELFEIISRGDDGDAELFIRRFRSSYCFDHAARHSGGN
jgi:primase-polymerase (primpol)-like protein